MDEMILLFVLMIWKVWYASGGSVVCHCGRGQCFTRVLRVRLGRRPSAVLASVAWLLLLLLSVS